MDRRTFLATAGVMAGLAAAGKAIGQEHPGGDHPKGDHPKGDHPKGEHPKGGPATGGLKAVVDSTFHCLKTGEDCLRHCAESLAAGNKLMGDCNKAVLNMLALCGALAKVASYGTAAADRIQRLAAVCGDICRDCAAMCKPHAGHHEACKQCMESCEACAKACDAVRGG